MEEIGILKGNTNARNIIIPKRKEDLIDYEEINKKSPLTDDEVLAIIKKQVKTRKDSMNEYASYNRMDLADSLQKEIDILNEYLPEELSDEELEKIVKETITKVKAESIKQMGMVIKTISSEYGARCDMAKVSKLVKERLS